MPLTTKLVGLEAESFTSKIEDRWAMNFAAGIGDANPLLYDTRREVLPVHPLYLAYPESQATGHLLSRPEFAADEMGTLLQISQDTTIYKPLVSGMTLSTSARITGIQRHRLGALMTYQLISQDEWGEDVGLTTMWSLYRGLDVEGDDHVAGKGDANLGGSLDGGGGEVELVFPATACHTYSECARIWSAYHTDIKVAEAAGIDGLILHGSATLARIVSALCSEVPAMQIDKIERISAELRAMVFVPSIALLRFHDHRSHIAGKNSVSFDLRTDDGDKTLTRGSVSYSLS